MLDFRSPLVWGDRVYVTGASEEKREIYCFDANSGKLLWTGPVGTPQGSRAEPPELSSDPFSNRAATQAP